MPNKILIAPAGTKSVSIDGASYLVDAKGRVSVPASAAPALLSGGFEYPNPRLKMKIVAGGAANTDLTCSGIVPGDTPIQAVNLTDGTNVAVAAVLATKAHIGTGYDGHLTATSANAPGASGNGIRVKLVGDSGTSGGVTISRDGKDVIIHYESGVSTQANVNTAIGALAGANDLFDVTTAGTTATTLTAPGHNTDWESFSGGADAYDAVGTTGATGKIQFPIDTTGKKILVLFESNG